MKKFALLLMLGIVLGSGIANAAPISLVQQGDTWNYSVLKTDLWPGWSSVGYNSVNWNALSWSVGQAAFGNNGPLAQHTNWAADTDLALTKNILVNGTLTGPLTLDVAVDNGFAIFINGTQVAKDNAEGYTSYWEYNLSADSGLIHQGLNTISVLAEDHGGSTFFDMQLKGDIQSAPVPEPTTIFLFGAGLAGLAVYRKKFRI